MRDHAWQLPAFDHRVDGAARGAQQVRRFVHREQNGQGAFS